MSFALDYRSFAYYEVKIHDWFVEENDYMIEIASSSRDIRLRGTVTVQATQELPFHFTELSPIGSLQKTVKGRKLWEHMISQMQEVQAGQQSSMEEGALGEGSNQMMQNMMLEMPIGALVGFDSISQEQLKEMLGMLNS